MSEQTGNVAAPDRDLAPDLVFAIRTGDVDAVRGLLSESPALARRPLGGPVKTRTALHVVSDWSGYFPNGPEIVRVLIAAGADPDYRDAEPRSETPLHWAASSDDADVAAALIDGGADLEVPNGSIGTPLDNAIGYGCWQVARLLVARGARVDKLWHAAALGLLDRLEELLAANPTAEAISQGFWHACAGGQRRAAEHLLAAGAGLNWEPDYAHGTPLDAAAGLGTQRENVITWLKEKERARPTPTRAEATQQKRPSITPNAGRRRPLLRSSAAWGRCQGGRVRSAGSRPSIVGGWP